MPSVTKNSGLIHKITDNPGFGKQTSKYPCQKSPGEGPKQKGRPLSGGYGEDPASLEDRAAEHIITRGRQNCQCPVRVAGGGCHRNRPMAACGSCYCLSLSVKAGAISFRAVRLMPQELAISRHSIRMVASIFRASFSAASRANPKKGAT